VPVKVEPITVLGKTIINPFEKDIRNQSVSFIDFNNLSVENNAY
jgi:hypothetical protein